VTKTTAVCPWDDVAGVLQDVRRHVLDIAALEDIEAVRMALTGLAISLDVGRSTSEQRRAQLAELWQKAEPAEVRAIH
jgi:hypothetical protein